MAHPSGAGHGLNLPRNSRVGTIEPVLSTDDATSLLARPPLSTSENGVYRFVDDGAYANSFGLQWNEFATVQLDTPAHPDSERRMLAESGFTPESIAGCKVLEAGCGMGRFLDVISRWGASVAYGIDLSSAVDAAATNLAGRDNVAIGQADIFDLPFAEGTFDAIYSLGVLHHTPDCEGAFHALVPFVAPGGEIAISVYAAVNQTGALSAINLNRRKAMRSVTKRLPKPFMLWWSKTAPPFFVKLAKVPVLKYLRFAFPVMIYTEHPASWSVLDTFDTFATHYESRHREKEVFDWFRQAGLVNIDLLPSEDGWVSVRGRKPAA